MHNVQIKHYYGVLIVRCLDRFAVCQKQNLKDIRFLTQIAKLRDNGHQKRLFHLISI